MLPFANVISKRKNFSRGGGSEIYNLHHIAPYHIVVLKPQYRLKVGTDKPKLKVKMQTISDDEPIMQVEKMPLKINQIACKK